ncbi:MAG: transposase [Candidatus Hydrogenedentes bacterium]|nr:transposase [Candidatus Hydrogenedentota bacterium]
MHAGGLSRKEAARQFGLAPSYLKKLSAEFQQALRQGEPCFFPPPKKGPKQGHGNAVASAVDRIVALRKKNHWVPDIHAILTAQGQSPSLTTIDRILKQEGFAPLPKRTRQERAATAVPPSIEAPESAPLIWRHETFTTEQGGGPLVFLPLLEHLGIVPALVRAGYPKTAVLSDVASVLSFLALKLLGNERLSHDAPYNLDRALGLFAGLNVLPKSSTLSSYSYRVERQQNRALLCQLSRIFQDAPAEQGEFNLDFKAIPHWGDASVLENNWSGMRRQGIKSLLALLVEDPATGLLSYTDAGIRHRNESDAVLEFVDFWKEGRGMVPKLLIFDSRFTTDENLSKLNQSGIQFLTLRRRGKQLVQKANALPEGEWTPVTFEQENRKRRTVRVHDSLITLRHYEGELRQVILTGHGHVRPTFLITNDRDLPVLHVIKKYARRWLVEQEIAEQIDFFHLNSPSSSIVVKVDFDLTLSLLAHNLFRTLTRQIPGFERCTIATIAGDVLQNGTAVSIENRAITIHLKKKTHLPALFEVPWMKQTTPLSWMKASIAFDIDTTS